MADRVADKIDRFWTAANLVTLSRLLLAPVLLVLARLGLARELAVALAVSLAADAVDRKLARRSGQTPRRGARLDSWASLATCTSVPLCLYWLRPELIQSEPVAFWVIVAGFAAPVSYGFIKYGSLIACHTRAAVIAAALVAGAAIGLIAGGPVWPLGIAAAALALAALEAIAIITALPEPVDPVRSLPDALRIRRERSGGGLSGDLED